MMLERTCPSHVLRGFMEKTATRLNGELKDESLSTPSVKTVSSTPQ